MNLKVITQKKLVLEKEITSITVPSAAGEITILPHHEHLVSLLEEGVMGIKSSDGEEYMAIGGGYLETNGSVVRVLVSRAYNQDALNQEQTEKAMQDAQKALSDAKTKTDREEAMAILRRSTVDLKLMRKVRRHTTS